MQKPNQSPKASTVHPDSIGAAALEALQKAKAEQEANNAISGEDISSLNKLLQWSTTHTGPSQGNDSSHAVKKTSEQLATDREWLDAAFPDTYAEINGLVRMLTEESLDADMTVEVLEGLQDYFLDLNYAVNIEKIGAVEPVLLRTRHDSAEVRAAAVWVIGSAMRDLQEVKDIFMRHDVHIILAERLRDDDSKVRAKAVLASSALLRHSTEEIQTKFNEAGGIASFRALLSDTNMLVRRRARFFLQHALATGNASFVADLLTDRNAVVALSLSIEQLDVNDVADVEAAVGALDVLVDTDLQGLLQVAPELTGIVDSLAKKSDDPSLAELLSKLADRLG